MQFIDFKDPIPRSLASLTSSLGDCRCEITIVYLSSIHHRLKLKILCVLLLNSMMAKLLPSKFFICPPPSFEIGHLPQAVMLNGAKTKTNKKKEKCSKRKLRCSKADQLWTKPQVYFPPLFLADILQCWKSGLRESVETDQLCGDAYRPGRLWWKGSNEA